MGARSKQVTKTVFKVRHIRKSTADRGKDFDEKGVAVQKCSCLYLRDIGREEEQYYQIMEHVDVPQHVESH